MSRDGLSLAHARVGVESVEHASQGIQPRCWLRGAEKGLACTGWGLRLHGHQPWRREGGGGCWPRSQQWCRAESGEVNLCMRVADVRGVGDKRRGGDSRYAGVNGKLDNCLVHASF